MSEASNHSATTSAASTDQAFDASVRIRRALLAAFVVALVLVADLWTKQWAWDTLRNGPSIPVIQDVLHFKFGFNTGSAFSLFSDMPWARAFFISITVVALGYMGWLTTQMPSSKRYGFVAIGLIAGGAAGNLHDRFVRMMPSYADGEMRYGVVDFIQFFYDFKGEQFWPIFNVADSALLCGVGLLLIYMYKQGQEQAIAEVAAQGSGQAIGGSEADGATI